MSSVPQHHEQRHQPLAERQRYHKQMQQSLAERQRHCKQRQQLLGDRRWYRKERRLRSLWQSGGSTAREGGCGTWWSLEPWNW